MEIMGLTALITKIHAIPAGKTLGVIGADVSVFVRHTDAGFEVEAAWVVPEAHQDDYEASTYHPFKIDGYPRPAVPWVGRRIHTTTATEAAEMYTAVKAALRYGLPVTQGEVIGSVQR